jgi:hypothetical protein
MVSAVPSLVMANFVAGVGASVASTSFAWSTNTYYWIRFRLDGTSLKGRIWADGGAEPGTWTLEATDSAIQGAGWLGAFANNTGNSDFDFLSYATGGLTAPSS